MSSSILYEQPLNERIRAFLRLEHLFSQVAHFQDGYSVWESHASVSALIEILTILDRSDIRSEVMKELDRHINGLSKLLGAPNVDRFELDKTLQSLTAHLHAIQRLPTKFSSAIRENDLLNGVRQRVAITGGTCGFDIPAYHYWLNQSSGFKSECLSRWVAEFDPIKNSILLLLKLTRESAFFEHQSATNGFYQKALDTQNPCQLLRIVLSSSYQAYPEVSGNKHRVNIRFLTYNELGRPKPINTDLEFDMSCCTI